METKPQLSPATPELIKAMARAMAFADDEEFGEASWEAYVTLARAAAVPVESMILKKADQYRTGTASWRYIVSITAAFTAIEAEIAHQKPGSET